MELKTPLHNFYELINIPTENDTNTNENKKYLNLHCINTRNILILDFYGLNHNKSNDTKNDFHNLESNTI